MNTTEISWPEGFQPEPGMPERLSLLRWKLGYKAKQEPSFRFYALYDRVYRRDTLEMAYRLVKKNGGCPGTDGIDFEDIEQSEGGLERFIDELREALKSKSYRSAAVLRVYIPKANSKLRPLGIPCIRDRVVQAAVKLIIEPIFEVDFLECSYGFRPKRNAHMAIEEIREGIKAGRTEIYDADLSSYFDTIEHELLMEKVKKRIADGSILRLIRMWLKSPIEEDNGKGGRKRSHPRSGTPQGGVISPLLANIFLHEMDKAFHEGDQAPRNFANARLIRYADDFVVMARHMGYRIKNWIEETIEGTLKLKLNQEKTSVVKLKEDKAMLNFLGFSLRLDRDLHGRDQKYLNLFPSKKAECRFKDKIRSMTRSGFKRNLKDTVEAINRVSVGWKNYFNIGYPRKSFRKLNWFVHQRLSGMMNHRSQRKCKPNRQGETHYAMLKRMGLVWL